MKIFHYRRSLLEYLQSHKSNIGFVPTMGALHQGHISLVEAAKSNGSLCVVSIFVNPRQFNNASDLQHYPRTLAGDLQILQQAGTDAVFIPEVSEIFSEEASISLRIAPLDTVFEGKFRPGHFQGVIDVLYAFFNTIKPNMVFMGLKDLQQCMVVEKLLAAYFPETLQQNCPTLREPSGLAMSSRNMRLSDSGRQKAAAIYKELTNLGHTHGEIATHKAKAITTMQSLGIETEYLDLVSLPDMEVLVAQRPGKRMAIVFAGYLEGVRLIDNILV